MKNKSGFLICLLFVTASVSGTAKASLTWKLTGEVDTVAARFSHIFSVGDSVEYIFTFDPLTPDTDPDPVWGRYINAISTATITVGSYTASIENYGIELFNDSDWGQPEDLIAFQTHSPETVLNGPDLLGSDNYTYSLSGFHGNHQDQDGTPNMLLSDSLPITPDGINNLSTRKTFIVAWYSPQGGADGVTTTNIQLTDITPVPLPAALWLFGSGLLGLVGIGRKKAT